MLVISMYLGEGCEVLLGGGGVVGIEGSHGAVRVGHQLAACYGQHRGQGQSGLNTDICIIYYLQSYKIYYYLRGLY